VIGDAEPASRIFGAMTAGQRRRSGGMPRITLSLGRPESSPQSEIELDTKPLYD